MTHYILPKKIITNTAFQVVYKLSIIIYSLHISFSAQVFALSVEAPKYTAATPSPSTEVSLADLSLEELEVRLGEQIRLLQAERALKIQKYYARYDLPLQHEAASFVFFADKYDIDWRLVAAIGFIESTGGKHACSTATYSAFGWGSCKINFNSYSESIDVVSRNLGGHNPNTEYFYKDKDIKGILQSYNPPSVIPDYAQQVMRQMDIIDQQ